MTNMMIEKEHFLDLLGDLCAQQQHSSCLVFAEINNATQVASFLQGFAAEQQLISEVEQFIAREVLEYSGTIFAKLEHNRFGLVIAKSAAESLVIAEQLVYALDKEVISVGEKTYYPKLYCGVTPLAPSYKEPKLAFAAADLALYEARLTGGSTVRLLEPEAPKLANYHQALRLLPVIRAGLLNKLFVLFAQPIVPLDKHSVAQKAEVLLRYQDAEGVIHAPFKYLSAAELFHVSREIDLYVVHQFCLFMQNNEDQRTVYALNISGNTVRYHQFFDYVAE